MKVTSDVKMLDLTFHFNGAGEVPLPSEVWELPSQCWIGVSMLTISAGLKINIKKKTR